ncbi:hypothetical protein [Desulfatirhabdium butyrativorans]|uniref:hypothetical protein n=1 Tax=Desulfatirhabdium butyrativorans TaxID=340467 RepID=UPI000486DDC1|nr:hypothetical protein [Desulfatirhabdium butyrativorans]
METAILEKLLVCLTRPESLVLLLWIVTEKIERRHESMTFEATIEKMLNQEREFGETLARISGLLQGMLPTRGGSV